MQLKTKYDVGQAFWGMRDNRPTEYVIGKIEINVRSVERERADEELSFIEQRISVQYKLFIDRRYFEAEVYEENMDNIFFASKELLILSLLKK